MPQNIGDNRISADGIARITLADAERLSKYRVKPGDIVYSRRGDVERRALVRDSEDGWLCGTGCLRVRLGDGPVDPIFAAFYLGAAETREWIVRHAHGATMPNLNTSILSACPIIVPPLPEQRAIAATLGALDDKIELNRKMNATLEAMARALFRDWFVDFGPTRAKMAGTTPYLSPDLWSLFPDRLDDAGKPEGWAIHELGSVTKLQNGYAFKSKDWSDSGIPVVKIGSVKPRFVDIDQVSYVNDDLAADKSNFRLSVGDMLVGLTGYVGETGRVPPTDIPPMLNQRVGRFLPEDGLEAFVFTAVRQPDFKAYAEAKAHGSAQANVSTKDLLTFPITTPDDIALKAFCELISPLFQRSLENTGENSTLAQTRDLLLPRLMSGELRVAGAEYAVEAVL